MENVTTPSEAHPEESDISSAGSEEAGSDEKVVEQAIETADESKEEKGRELNPEEMQKTLNKQFNKINELEEKMAKLAKNPNPDSSEVRQELDELNSKLNQANFYKDNPEYEAYRDLLGNDPEEAIKNPAVKSTVDKAIAHDTSQSSKSVLQSNPRLGQVRDKMTKAKELSNAGDQTNASTTATEAVIDAFDLS